MRLTVQSFLLNKRLSFPVEASDKECSCQCRRHKKCRFDPWVGRISWKREWLPLQYSCLENSMGRGAWWATVYGVAKSPTQLKLPSTHTVIGIQSAPPLLNFTTTSLKASLHVRLSYQGKKKIQGISKGNKHNLETLEQTSKWDMASMLGILEQEFRKTVR